jgi:hypothetical protein
MDWRLSGGEIEFERRFELFETISPYVSLGVGVGILRTKFRGNFDGVYLPTGTRIRGANANEDSTHILPIVELGGGMTIALPYNLLLSPGIRIGTPGYTAGINLEYSW